MANVIVGGNNPVSNQGYDLNNNTTYIDLNNPITVDCKLIEVKVYWQYATVTAEAKLIIFRDNGTEYVPVAHFDFPATHDSGLSSYIIDIDVLENDLVAFYGLNYNAVVAKLDTGNSAGYGGDMSETTSLKSIWGDVAQSLSIEVLKAGVTTVQKSIVSDSKIKIINNQESILSDATIYVQPPKNISSDAKIKVIDNQENILSDSRIVIRESIVSDSKIKIEGVQKSITSDTMIQALIEEQFATNFITKLTKNKYVSTFLNTVLGKYLDVFQTSFFTRLGINNTVNTNLSTRLLAYDSITPKNLNSIIVYKDGAELLDVDYSTLKIQLNLNSTPSNATFVLARHHDDIDRNLLGLSSVITARNVITVYDAGILLFTGYITKINAVSSSDTVEVTAEDKRCLINEMEISFYYGGYTNAQIYQENITTVYQSIASAITYVLGVAGLSGSLGVNLVPEPTYFSGNCGAALDTLIGSSINASWYIDANGNFQIQKVAVGPVKTLPLSSQNSRRHIYDTILNDVMLNKITNNYAPKLNVTLGTMAIKTWVHWSCLSRNYYCAYNPITNELYMTDKVNKDIQDDLNYIKNVQLRGHNEAQIFATQNNVYTGNSVCLDKHFITYGNFSGGPLIGVSYYGQYLVQESTFSLPDISVGSGSPVKQLNLSQYGCKNSCGQLTTAEYSNKTYLGLDYEESYDYRPYALDLANFELSQNNKLLTEASISLILDAYEYYNIGLSDLINLSNTISGGIYNNTNGFPLNISGITIDCATRIVSINATNYGKTFSQRSGNYLNFYHSPFFIRWMPQYVSEE
jgi:hypothetical protein